MAKSIVIFKEAGRSSAMLWLAEAYHFSPITLLSGKYLKAANAATGSGKVKKMARLCNRVTI